MTHFAIRRLTDHPAALEPVVGWIDKEWGLFSGRSRDETRARFMEDHAASALPLTLVALDGTEAIGVASLRVRDSIDWDPTHGPWVCNVYVPPSARGRGIAEALCRGLEREALDLDFAALFLASARGEGSLYQRIGYRVYRVVEHDGERLHLMKRDLRADAAAPEEVE
jgi:GNAT superfamily N-acetyltransferase